MRKDLTVLHSNSQSVDTRLYQYPFKSIMPLPDTRKISILYFVFLAEHAVLSLIPKTGRLSPIFCLILFFTSTQQSFSYAGRFFLGLTSTKLG